MLKDYLEREEAATVMFAFADQEKEMNRALRHERSEGEKIGEECGVKIGIERGVQIGEARGEKNGEIKGVIKLYQDEMHLLPTEIVKRIMERFSLKEDVAKNYVVETLGVATV